MGAKKNEKKKTGGEVTIQLNLVGLVIFSGALVTAAALVTYGLVTDHFRNGRPAAISARDVIQTNSELDVNELKEVPAWGQLIVRPLDLEQPEEYVAYETATNKIETWVFEGMTPDKVRTTMQSSGLVAGDIERALQTVAYAGSNTVVQPDETLVFSMPPETRARLYGVLGRSPANELFHFPFCFPGDSFESRFDKSRIGPGNLFIAEKDVVSARRCPMFQRFANVAESYDR